MPVKRAPEAQTVEVIFSLPAEIEAEEIALVGEFNDWNPDTKLARIDDGSWQATISLAPGAYRYRYLLDGGRWENAWDADEYVPNPYGGNDSVIVVG